MPWETRGGHRYYYRSRRDGDRVRKVYLGSGATAKSVARRDAAARAERAADKAQLLRLDAELAPLTQMAAEFERGVGRLLEASLLSMGYHRHRGQWRKYRNLDRRRLPVPNRSTEDNMGRKSRKQLVAEQEQAQLERERELAETAKRQAEEEQRRTKAMLAAMTPLERAIYRTRQGDPEGMTELGKLLDEDPTLWQHQGNLGQRVLEGWLLLISDNDPYQFESLQRHFEEMREGLTGPSSSLTERLMVDHIIDCQVRRMYFSALEKNPTIRENLKLAKYVAWRQERADRQYLAAMKTLATTRELLARMPPARGQATHKFVPKAA